MCGKRYLGETKNSILMRMSAHRYALRKGLQDKVHNGPNFGKHQGVRLEHDPNWEKIF